MLQLQEFEDVDTHRLSILDYSSSLYLFYVKLLLELSSRSHHVCLLREHLDKLNNDLLSTKHPHHGLVVCI